MAVLSLLLVAVCLSDYRSRRIPNVLVLLILLFGGIYRFRQGGSAGLLSYFLVCILVYLVMYPFFKLGTIGAGDVKLFSATAGYLLGKSVFFFLLYSLLIAAVFSFVKILKEKNGSERFYYLASYMKEVIRTGKWHLYIQNMAEKKKTGICLSGPLFISVLLYWGGVY